MEEDSSSLKRPKSSGGSDSEVEPSRKSAKVSLEEDSSSLKRPKPSGGSDSEHEPSRKCAKVSLEGPASNLAAHDDLSVGNPETIGSKGFIKKIEFVRIIAEALDSLGYEKSVDLLENESGIPLHSPIVKTLIQQVCDENWDGSVATLHQYNSLDETIVKSAATLTIMEQKFFEFISAEKYSDALHTLQNDISPVCSNPSQCHDLASCLISTKHCKKLGIFNEDTGFVAYRSKTGERLQRVLPPGVIVPEKRLVNLLEQILDDRRNNCPFHNCYISEMSLYSDHFCESTRIPSETLQILQAHTDEVWSLQFSHNGEYLASGSKDKSAAIWKVDENGKVLLKHRLIGHNGPVSAVLWSPDDRQLLTCGLEEVMQRWDVSSGACLHVYLKPGVGVLSCEWHPTGERIYSGMADNSICVWDLNGVEGEILIGQQPISISDVAITLDGKKLITQSSNTEISWFDTEINQNQVLITGNDVITSFCLSKNNKFLLVNYSNEIIRLWSIQGEPVVEADYEEHKRTRFLTRSCFGGFEDVCIASGSEDSLVYIWYRDTMGLVNALPGHSGAVNCVSWHPTNIHLFASASDDCTIRIWGSEHFMKKLENCRRSGTAHQSNSDGTA